MTKSERQALEFLSLGPDCVGLIDTEEKLAAAILFCNLQQMGYAISEVGPDGPIHRITPKGRAALQQSKDTP
jgi:hypothetical protein